MVVEDTHPAASLPPIRLLNTYPVETAAVVLRAGLPAHLVAAVHECYLSKGLLLTAMRRAPLEPRAVDSAGLPPWVCAKGVSPPPVCSLWRGENAVARTQALEREITAVLTKCGGLPGPEEIGEAPPPPRTPPRRATGPPPFISQADILCVAGSEADSLRCAMHLAVNEGAEPVGGVAFAQRVADAPSRLSSTPELPQVACVVVTPDCVSDPIAVRALLEKLFSKGPKGLGADLLGCKLLSWLPDHASRELCPVPKGNVQRDESLEALESGPVLAFAVRLPDAFTRLAALLGPLPDSPEAVLARNSYAGVHDTIRALHGVDAVRCAAIASTDARAALRQLVALFDDSELAWPHTATGPLSMLPPPTSDTVLESLKTDGEAAGEIDTVCVVKHEARSQLAKVLKYVRRGGFDVAAARMLSPSPEEAALLCAHLDGAGANTLQGRACTVLLLRRFNAVAAWLSTCGPDDPKEAARVDQFTLRAMFGTSLTCNALHASPSFSAAGLEKKALFPEFNGSSAPGNDLVCGAARRKVVSKDGEERTLKQVLLVAMCGAVVEEQEYVGAVESLLAEDFKIVNLRVGHLSRRQATELAGILGTRSAEEPLARGPTLLLAVERDSCMARFQMALSKRSAPGGGSSSGGLADVCARFRGQVLWADTPLKATASVAYCFGELLDSAFLIAPA